ncbi:peptide-N(4)-(N-acetyl-beta-glucosaminyl)asparagine amidase-like isoform X1 [Camellia sinensis]|uniref:peptide-N(4)-(N-acetyl-beta- glucosaminyl)asparagine amidase-like isoform X1 n=1 Tax=Camellia sinensis TaxID=4442 RepID=UPI0010359211|nr:peptide-N(4)-(N-acetyl-beta-glucosaminyl)asparagine amidase-like isoform X1 [Camellia sinensis]
MGNQKQKWTTEEEEALRAGVAKHGTGKWKNILKDPDFALSLSQRSNIDLKDKWRNMGISTAAHSSKEKIRIPRVKAITAGPLTNGQNSASASLIDDDKDGKTAPRWMHLDPCEGIYDNPLLYEKGWKKNLNYVIAFAKDGVYDVTKRYSRKWHEVLSRRNITTDPILSIILSNIRRECRQSFASQVISALEDQDRNEAEALERELHSKDDASISLPGRQSGDKEWRMSRSEFGSDEICFPSSSCCPARKCIDEHVTKIYNAFCPIISQFVEKSCSKSRAVEVLLFFKQMLINLKNSPFRTRRTSINPVSNGAQHLFLQMLPSFDQLFDALSLNSELDASGRVDIYLAADPVRTSIALPVLFHALDDVIHNVNMCNNFNKNSLSWPLQKLNRIYSGLVLASGEELSFGIALLSTNFRSHLHLTELECQSGKNQMVPEVKVV